MKYGFGYRTKVAKKWYDYVPDCLGNTAILIDVLTKESRVVHTHTQALELSEKEVKTLVKAAFYAEV
jgi:hypothetical protein